MRTLVLVVGILVSTVSAVRADDAVVTPPAAAQAVIDKLEAAVAKGDARALVALVAGKVTVLDQTDTSSKTLTRARLTAAIKKAGGVAKWLRITDASVSWAVAAQGEGFRLEGSDALHFELFASHGTWRVTEIQLTGLPDRMGGLVGTGEMAGGGGFGLGSGGGGGCGGGYGTIGTGKYGTIGHGSGYGVGGGGCGGMRGRRVSLPKMTMSTPHVTGKLETAVVRRYLRRNGEKFEYCYEKQLLAKPKLKGKVAIAFSVDGSGAVQSPTATGVDPDVASCVIGVLSSIELPKPEGGGTVSVTFSITYAPTGG